MNKDETVIIERVGNGFIVRPSSNYVGDRITLLENVFVFETFPALVMWLDNHYTKPEDKKND
jgi:hypothetical protein